MADPMKIRAAMNGEFTEVKVLMAHPMETGLRKDASSGGVFPAHYISEVSATCAGKTVLEGRFSQSVSQNPYLAFRFKGGVKGAKVQVSWVDNKGDKRSDEATIA
ncbi:MAG: thiosulfate oxidation carrier complex protein SoxZ [Pseudomonadota bacterium]|nr:thiosulfate oxidation carrier complex protein SoxZ [Pseudomonadota bacterium]